MLSPMQSSQSTWGMKTPRYLFLLVLSLAACKVEPTPGVCCTTDADCARLGGIPPRGCPDGYACRDLLCEAAICAAAADCAADQPVCDLDSASCTGCTAGSDCGRYPDAPVCDPATGGCRACALDAECASEVCDIDTGRCVAESAIIYASPSGADTAECTHQQPCSSTRAIAVASADPSSSLVRLLPGMYTSLLAFSSGVVQVVGSGATLRSPLVAQPIEVHESAVVEIRGLDIGGDVECASTTSLFPSLTLRDSTIHLSAVIVSHSFVRMLRSRLEDGIVALRDDGTFEADQARFEGTELDVWGHRMHVRLANSILDRVSFNMNNIDIFPDKSEYYVSFNTFVFDTQALKCPQSSNYQSNAVLDNNIFFSASPMITNVIIPGYCTLSGNITHPQEPDLGGTNIDQDPAFVDLQGKDYRLQPGSPAVDAAVSSSGPGLDHDFAGTPRPQGARKDIGAFELEQ
jgi:hypothetical protein